MIPLKPIKWYKNLATLKGRLEEGAFLVEGDRAIRQVIGISPADIIEILAVDSLPDIYHEYPFRLITDSQLHSISSTQSPQGTIAVVRMPTDIYSDNIPETVGSKVLLLEDIQDPGNAGTLIRTAAAFDYSGVILTDKCADPLSPKCVQSTAGTVLSVWLRRTALYLDLVEALKVKGYSVITTDLRGCDNPSVLGEQGKIILALGNEASGVSEALSGISDYRVKLPIAAEKSESLNVAACGVICMYLSSQV